LGGRGTTGRKGSRNRSERDRNRLERGRETEQKVIDKGRKGSGEWRDRMKEGETVRKIGETCR
jgi:hypothetical protein